MMPVRRQRREENLHHPQATKTARTLLRLLEPLMPHAQSQRTSARRLRVRVGRPTRPISTLAYSFWFKENKLRSALLSSPILPASSDLPHHFLFPSLFGVALFLCTTVQCGIANRRRASPKQKNPPPLLASFKSAFCFFWHIASDPTRSEQDELYANS